MQRADTSLTLADELLIDAEVETVVPERQGRSSLSRVILGVSMVLIAFNLRPLFSSASTLLPEIRTAFALSPVDATLLTTLPVLCLGLFSPLAPKLADRYGAEKTLLVVLLLLGLGIGLRGFGVVSLLYFGTAMAGACIAIGNVLLPGLVKRDFSGNAALMTGLYTMALCGGAAAAAGLTQPIKAMTGSIEMGLGLWALPAGLVFLLWLPQSLSRHAAHTPSNVKIRGLWRDPLAWNVTLFTGLQSALAYCVFGWLAPILRERGLDAVTAGNIVSVSVMIQGFACILAPQLAVRGKNQSLVNAGAVTIAVVALIGFLFAPLSTVWLWAVLQGIGQGSLIALAMTMIVLRSGTPQIAAHLSGMAQFVGYSLAAGGPLLVGSIRAMTGSFHETAFLFLAIGLGAAWNGWRAGRNLHVTATIITRQERSV
ncbi:CynX/NimT family MFS transporter [Allorhizobium sp. BGMRC 0089]|uniref:CynX/NimT family MFS transporter n=1 Tax=Allorhizobium sonneratiae TaxID=2934936 RepID=UPI002033F9C0|nr:CynX/NimT family MFS transporter [Allorhizobium sonneratiae]MCM2290726.1 CynX/NimT family MFS transporter [Allorhizobium sonneratiae]